MHVLQAISNPEALERALTTGSVAVEGGVEALRRCLEVFAPARVDAAARATA
jgi:hypothetical protein